MTENRRDAFDVRWDVVRYTRGRGLDVGYQGQKLFPHMLGIDNTDNLSMFSSQSMDFVFISNAKADEQEKLFRDCWRLLKYSGHLCVHGPVVADMEKVGAWDLMEKTDNLLVYRKQHSGFRYSYRDPEPSKRAAVVRYGAFGDIIQAANLFPELQKQGYHVTFYTNERGEEIAKTDPYVDDLYVQGTDQVPNYLLSEFWDHEKKKYEKWVNLSETVEGTLLAMPGRSNHEWPQEVRHAMMNVNYLEFTHDIAQVPYVFKGRFHPTDQEKTWAKRERAKLGNFVIMWPLAGSSVHKVWPHMDALIARIMLQTDAEVIFTGDYFSKLLEQGWEKEKRVLLKSGEWSIRQTLAFIDECDCLIGPETGVMNAAAFLPMHKIIFLSHSTQENLTKHWKNTQAFCSPETPCYPCHRLHKGWDFCTMHEESTTALCQWNIDVDRVWDHLYAYFRDYSIQRKQG